MATPWTPGEILDATLLTWAAFAEKYPNRTYDSWEVKRRRAAAPVAKAEQLVDIPDARGYVGPLIGYWDLETTFSMHPRILSGAICDGFGEVQLFDKYEYPGTEWIDDRDLAVAIRDALEKYDVLCGWNSKLFDVPVLNGRLLRYGERPLRAQMHIDLMYYAGGQFTRIGSKSLQNVSTFFKSPNRKTPLLIETWDRADHGSKVDYDLIREHNVADVKVTRDVFSWLKPHIRTIHRAG